MDIFTVLSGVVASAFLAGGVLALAGLGETISQRSGVFNLGIEGFMAIGGITAIATVLATGSLFAAVLAAAASGAAMGLFFAATIILWRVNQVVSGLAFAFLGTGLAAWIGTAYAGKPAEVSFEKFPIPGLSDIPFLGNALFNHPLPVYVTFFILPFVLNYVLFHTRFGLSILAVGENPNAADATGISVVPLRMACVVFGCTMAALSGAYLTLVFVPSWSEGITAGRGWIAIAMVIFAAYRPIRVTVSAFMFGLIVAVGFSAQTWGWNVPSAFLSALPYLVTLAFMVFPVWVKITGYRNARPEGLGVPFFSDTR
ncbi:MAG: ABC transporter permease [Blastopirellula sp.]|nr:MAG: ABC transporter permease [Blastopirellula sp.]